MKFLKISDTLQYLGLLPNFLKNIKKREPLLVSEVSCYFAKNKIRLNSPSTSLHHLVESVNWFSTAVLQNFSEQFDTPFIQSSMDRPQEFLIIKVSTADLRNHLYICEFEVVPLFSTEVAKNATT